MYSVNVKHDIGVFDESIVKGVVVEAKDTANRSRSSSCSSDEGTAPDAETVSSLHFIESCSRKNGNTNSFNPVE